MNFYCGSIDAGIALLHWCDISRTKADKPKDIRRFEHWKAMALRDGAITINNFYHEILAIDQNLKSIPVMRQQIQMTEKRLAKRLFESSFPSCKAIRHGVAHLAELYSTPDQLKKHGRGWINTMIGHSYHTSVKGEAVSYDLTPTIHRKLLAVERLMWSAFTRVLVERSNQSGGA
jgi:hypothetical protein